MPAISVIIPVYNADQTIIETIASVQKQTFTDFEMVVIDDGSLDQTLEMLSCIEDHRLKIFSYSNQGTAAARNRGISHATGDFIALLDADDLWTPDKLERQLEALQQNPQAGAAYSWTTYFVDQNIKRRFFPSKPVYFQGNVYAQLLIRNFIAHGSNLLIRRKAVESVGEFDSTCQHCEDWDFYLRLAARWPFVLVPKHQVLYRQSLQSKSSNLHTFEQAGLKMINKAFQAAPLELRSLKCQSLAHFYEYLTQKYLHQTHPGSINQARQSLWRAVCLHPQVLLGAYTQDLILQLIKKWVKMILALPVIKI
jgi:glycosyltransferase involved in cell wall biosynthesis